MAVETLVPPKSERLASLDRIKLLMRKEDTSEDALLGVLIDTASSLIAEVIGFPLGRRQVRETFPGTHGTHLVLTCLPIAVDTLAMTVDDGEVSDFTVDPETGITFRRDGWGGTVYPNWWLGSQGWSTGNQRVVGEEPQSNISATYWGGYLLPEDVSTWSAEAHYETGDWVRLAAPSVLRLQCSEAGTSGPTPPAYPAGGEDVTDGSVTWIARRAWELPGAFLEWTFAEVLRRYSRLSLSPDITSLAAEGFQATFSAAQTSEALSPHVYNGVRIWRMGRGGIA